MDCAVEEALKALKESVREENGTRINLYSPFVGPDCAFLHQQIPSLHVRLAQVGKRTGSSCRPVLRRARAGKGNRAPLWAHFQLSGAYTEDCGAITTKYTGRVLHLHGQQFDFSGVELNK